MKVYCGRCLRLGIPILEAFANSTDSYMHCRKCDAVVSIRKPARMILYTVQGAAVIVGAIYSVSSMSFVPVSVGVAVVVIVRIAVAPLLAKRVDKDSLFDSLTGN